MHTTLQHIREQLRVGAVATSVALHWRHRRRFSRWPFKLASTVDVDVAPEVKTSLQRSFFTMPDCCLGFTAADLRRRINTCLYTFRFYYISILHILVFVVWCMHGGGEREGDNMFVWAAVLLGEFAFRLGRFWARECYQYSCISSGNIACSLIV